MSAARMKAAEKQLETLVRNRGNPNACFHPNMDFSKVDLGRLHKWMDTASIQRWGNLHGIKLVGNLFGEEFTPEMAEELEALETRNDVATWKAYQSWRLSTEKPPSNEPVTREAVEREMSKFFERPPKSN